MSLNMVLGNLRIFPRLPRWHRNRRLPLMLFFYIYIKVSLSFSQVKLRGWQAHCDIKMIEMALPFRNTISTSKAYHHLLIQTTMMIIRTRYPQLARCQARNQCHIRVIAISSLLPMAKAKNKILINKTTMGRRVNRWGYSKITRPTLLLQGLKAN